MTCKYTTAFGMQHYYNVDFSTGLVTASELNVRSGSQNTTTASLSADEKEVFDLINKQRTNNGLATLKVDSEVQRVARIKAQDIIRT